MLRVGCRRAAGIVLQRQAERVRYASNLSSHHPNAPLELDTAFQALLRDVDISLRNKATQDVSRSHGPRELELYPNDPDAAADYLSSAELDAQDNIYGGKEGRKSPAAAFGSQRIGAVVLPLELQSTISRMITSE